MTAPILRKLADMRMLSDAWSSNGETIGVVPTMGALHAGHLSLVRAAKDECDRVVVWIFVNPMQFNNAEDLEKYPRTEEDDGRKLAEFGVDAIYAPDVDQVYPQGFATTIKIGGLTDVMEGTHRPGHFDGVATVVSKIFLQTGADRAYFGEKDYQQLMIVRRMAADLDIRTQVVACPTVREETGLAMSSRNLRLSAEAKLKAAELYVTLRDMADELRDGTVFRPLADRARARLIEAGFSEVEYFDLRSSDGLVALDHLTEPARIFVAAWMEGVRLIDNVAV